MVLFKIPKKAKEYIFNFIYLFIAFSVVSFICSTCKPIIENAETMRDKSSPSSRKIFVNNKRR